MGSTDGTVYGKFETLLLVALLGSLDIIEVGFTEGYELRIYDGKVIGTTLVTYDDT